MTKTIKTAWVTSTILLLTAIIAWKLFFPCEKNEKPKLEVIGFKTNDGWGYKIMHNEKQIIYQPFIPAIKERKAFETKETAVAAGNIVLRKIQSREIPMVTIEELEKAGIVSANKNGAEVIYNR